MSEAEQGWGFDPNAQPLKGASKCPHCGAVARTERDDEMRFVCSVCGGPRVVIEGEVKLSGGELEYLRRAQEHRKTRAARRAGGIASGAVGGMLGLGTMIVALLGASFGTTVVAAAVALPFVLLAVWMLSRAGGAGTAIREAVDRAWMSAARDVTAASKAPLTATQLQQALSLEQQDAEALLTRMQVDEQLVSRINAGGELVFEAAAGGSRIAPDLSAELGDLDPLEARFKALEAEQEAAAAEEADAAVAQRHKKS